MLAAWIKQQKTPTKRQVNSSADTFFWMTRYLPWMIEEFWPTLCKLLARRSDGQCTFEHLKNEFRKLSIMTLWSRIEKKHRKNSHPIILCSSTAVWFLDYSGPQCNDVTRLSSLVTQMEWSWKMIFFLLFAKMTLFFQWRHSSFVTRHSVGVDM